MSYQSIELVCHNGHVIMEGAWDVERATREENEKLVREFASKKLEPFCTICGSPTWSVREKQTEAATVVSIAKRFFDEQREVLKEHRDKAKRN
jgi:hypothetical protein